MYIMVHFVVKRPRRRKIQETVRKMADEIVWFGLKVLKAWQGRNENEGFVEFFAIFQVFDSSGMFGMKPADAPLQIFKEVSYFVKHEGKWMYMEPIEKDEDLASAAFSRMEQS